CDVLRSCVRPSIGRLGCPKWPTARLPALAGHFTLFRRHMLPALGHSLFYAPANVGTMPGAKTMASEQNAAESDQTDCLPESNLRPSKQAGQQPVPQLPHDQATNENE